MLRVTACVVGLAACGRIGFDAEVGPCDFEHRAAAPFATAAEPYVICTEDQLDEVGQHPELWSGRFELAADLDVATRPPVPYIGSTAMPFSGAFDGAGHTIAGLHYDDTATKDAVGLFAVITTSAHLANLRLVEFNVRGSARYVGALVGYGYGSLIENMILDGGTVIGAASTGGMIGGIECYDSPDEVPCPDGTIVRHVTVNATVVGTGTFAGVGGAFGYSGNNQSPLGIFDDIHTSGSVTGNEEIGGIGGDVEGIRLDHSDSSATVKAIQRAGGLTGDLTYGNTVITRSRATGDVTCSGGLCGGAISETDGAGVSQVSASGKVTCLGASCGGLAGDIAGTISECYATGDVSGTDQVGGLAGYAGGITDSYATGNVTGATMVGGLAGTTEPDITRSYATGTVTASGEFAGGLIGQFGVASTIADSFAVGSVTGASVNQRVGALLGGISSGTYTSSGNATSATCTNTAGTCTVDAAATAITDASYFTTATNAPMVRWDFTSIWQTVPGGLPKLRNVP